jgi:5,5'-dehydrodivanillate O-demethylase
MMLTAEDNELLTNVEPGAALHDLLSRYWFPVAAAVDLDENPIKPVRILGKDLTLFRDASGELGLVSQRCAHRAVDLSLGYISEEGLTCPYHGWTYNTLGECVDQPFEAEKNTFKSKCNLESYPVQALAGIIFAYVGPEPAPLLPLFDFLQYDNALRQMSAIVVNANWLQVVENSVDMRHVEWLHGHYLLHNLKALGVPDDDPRHEVARRFTRKHDRVKYEVTDYGLLRRTIMEGQDEDAENWQVGLPWYFPHVTYVHGGGVHGVGFRTPIDNEHTLFLTHTTYHVGEDVQLPRQESVPCSPVDLPILNGAYVPDTQTATDVVVFFGQSPRTDRTKEHLASSDAGVVALRRQLKSQINVVAEGGEPMNVIRDEADQVVVLPRVKSSYGRGFNEDGTYERGMASSAMALAAGPLTDQIEDAFEAAALARSKR